MSTGGRARPHLHPPEGTALGGDAVREQIGDGPKLAAQKVGQEPARYPRSGPLVQPGIPCGTAFGSTLARAWLSRTPSCRAHEGSDAHQRKTTNE